LRRCGDLARRLLGFLQLLSYGFVHSSISSDPMNQSLRDKLNAYVCVVSSDRVWSDLALPIFRIYWLPYFRNNPLLPRKGTVFVNDSQETFITLLQWLARSASSSSVSCTSSLVTIAGSIPQAGGAELCGDF
jgi:hypothetical protein